jgi:hypothetical protein
MRSLVFSVAMLAGLLASGAVWADTECNVPVSAWQSREVLRKELEQQGLQVQRIKVDDGCYEVRGVDVQGSKSAPDSLKVLQLETKDDERGERRRERSQGSK